jgi:hypothetical protein
MTPHAKIAVGVAAAVAALYFYGRTNTPTAPGASAAGANGVINDAGQAPVGTALQYSPTTTSVAGTPYAIPVDQQGSVIYGGVGPTPTDVINAANTSTVPNVPLGAFHQAVPYSLARFNTLASPEAKFCYAQYATGSSAATAINTVLAAPYGGPSGFARALQNYSGSGWNYNPATDTFSCIASGPNGQGRYGYTNLTGMEPLDTNGAPIGVSPSSTW